MKTLINKIITAGLVATLAFAGSFAFVSQPAFAGDVDPGQEVKDGVQAAGGTGARNNNLSGFIQTIINVLLFVIGAAAVIMIVIGGIRYVLSNGDSAQINGAKNTILYAVIGLVVALLAYAIVNFVITQFIKNP
ncbi:MAG TPA: pilin [Candidatus Saccharibacteria bacterium]|mgnify:FL=1|nr:pilin [Candidatus Saccharibacteria bacterium]HRK94009.1 pilin [Candidatus Saccharibacteria bacterium]